MIKLLPFTLFIRCIAETQSKVPEGELHDEPASDKVYTLTLLSMCVIGHPNTG